MKNITTSKNKQFQQEEGESILSSAQKFQITFPYSCKSGRCSTCKCRVIQGQTRPLGDETGLTTQEKTEGWILGCVRTALTDLLIQVEDLGDIALPEAKTVPCRINEINRLAPNIIQVLLRLPPSSNFDYIPGQYVDIIGNDGLRRSYSLANARGVSKQLELHIRAVEGGSMSDYWFSRAKVNDLLRLNGPLGTYFLRNIENKDLIFLATGTGVAPIKAMLESLSTAKNKQTPKSIIVIWGGRRPTDIYIDLPKITIDYQFIPVLSRPDKNWSGATGYVQDVLLDLNPDLNNVEVYACGSNRMIQSAKKKLIVSGLAPQNFYADAFLPSGSN